MNGAFFEIRCELRKLLAAALLLAAAAGWSGCGTGENAAERDGRAGNGDRDESMASTEVADAATATDARPAEAAAGHGDRPRLFRGTVTATPRGLRFVPCGGTAPLHLADDTGNDLAAIVGPPGTPEREVYVELMGEVAPLPSDNALPGVEGVIDARRLLFASREQGARGCEIDLAGIEVVARGNEPFWTVAVRREGITLTTPAHRDGLVFTDLEAVLQGGQRTYAARRSAAGGGPAELRLTIVEEPCRDSMAGDWHVWTARLELDGETRRGCARPGHPDTSDGGR
jgi:uncharacterized membrane protein